MSGYFYRLLGKYFAYHVRPSDSFADVNPLNDYIVKNLSAAWKTTIQIKSEATETVHEKLWENSPDYIILNGCLHFERDIQGLLERIHSSCMPETRILISYYSSLWKPVLRLATALGLRRKSPEKNWISPYDLDTLLGLSGFEKVSSQSRCLLPVWIPLLSRFVNSFLSPLPIFNHLNMFHIVVARPVFRKNLESKPSVSVIVPARNERENVRRIIERIPRICEDMEIIFVEGGSTDGTWEELVDIKERRGDNRNVIIAKQNGRGKGDAVRKGFSLASKDMLMILDADMTVAPEDLSRFYRAASSGLGEFINGSRLVYPMEKHAMQFVNMIGNKFFAMAFSYVLGQKLKDTLCGTKVLSRSSYEKIARNRIFFGEFDPFGDFDLIFGASRMGLKIIEVPVTYRERTFGQTNISRWRHGLILAGMLVFAIRRIRLY
jgi:hypothetical protein